MNFVAYVNIFAKSLHLSVEQMVIETLTFQQNNDPKHTSRLVKNYFIKKNRAAFLDTTISWFKPNRDS